MLLVDSHDPWQSAFDSLSGRFWLVLGMTMVLGAWLENTLRDCARKVFHVRELRRDPWRSAVFHLRAFLRDPLPLAVGSLSECLWLALGLAMCVGALLHKALCCCVSKSFLNEYIAVVAFVDADVR